MGAQCPEDDGRKGHRAFRAVRLGGKHDELAIHSMQATADPDHTLVCVDVAPLKAQDLTPPQAEKSEHHEHRVQPMPRDGIQKRPHLHYGCLLTPPPTAADGAGDERIRG
jgi:hypothetical protein